ncbi:MAG: abortive infection system antitoxin AbiGi family protein [Pseudomonadota bacterium]|nr:abortive infection system antitoxin AbiGi family protein [Pseudomonadota bacterium]
MRIEARSPFGYFKLKVNLYKSYWNRVFWNGDAEPSWTHSVCFSETPLSELSGFYQATTRKRNQYQKYGVAFFQEKLRELGGNPIFYVDSRRPDLLTALNSSLQNNKNDFIPMMYLIETFGPPVISAADGYSDFRWEREWRKKDSLDFKYEDLAFGICPADEIPFFNQQTNHQVTFIDPDWSEATLKSYLQANAPGLLAHF